MKLDMLLVSICLLLLLWGVIHNKPVIDHANKPPIQKTVLANMCPGSFASEIFRDSNGIPMVTVGIGTPPQYIDVCIDTASCDLIVALHNCTGCVPSKVFYADNSNTLTEMTDRCSRITFGTQRDSACWMKDNVVFDGRCIQSCEDLFGETPGSKITVLYEDIKFLGTHDRTKSDYNLPKSNYNIMGMCNPKTEDWPLISQLTDGKFGIVLGSKKAFVVLGEVPCRNLIKLDMYLHPEFYVAKSRSIKIGSAKLDSSPLTIIDTGSNMLFCPSMIHQQMMNLIKTQNYPDIEIDYGGITLTIRKSSYVENGAVYIEPSSTPNNSIIIGTLMLENTVIEFDTVTKQVSLGLL